MQRPRAARRFKINFNLDGRQSRPTHHASRSYARETASLFALSRTAHSMRVNWETRLGAAGGGAGCWAAAAAAASVGSAAIVQKLNSGAPFAFPLDSKLRWSYGQAVSWYRCLLARRMHRPQKLYS